MSVNKSRAIKTPTSNRYGTSPNGQKRFPLTDAMIRRRDAAALALGFVRRPCSLGPSEDTGIARDCWESEPLDHEWKGRMTAAYHCAPISGLNIRGEVDYHWPEEAERIAFSIDKGKSLPGDDAPKAKPEKVQGELLPGKETR